MHGAAERQIAAQADGQVGDTTEARLQRRQVGERLRGVHVAAVARVDHGHGRGARGDQRRSLLRVADGDHVHVVGHGLERVGDGLALGHRGELRAGEPDDLAAEPQHGGLEAQASARAGLIKKRGQHPAVAGMRHAFAVRIDVCRLVQQISNLGNGKRIQRDDALTDQRRLRRFLCD